MMTEELIRDFIIEEVKWRGSRRDLTADRQLIAEHILDSFAILHLVTFIETDLGVEVADEELVPENFASIGTIAGFVASKLPADAP